MIARFSQTRSPANFCAPFPQFRQSKQVFQQFQTRKSMAFDKVNLAEKFARFTDYANPRIAGELNESYVKLVKLKGEFVWHHHENEDEMFLIAKGQLVMKLRDRDVILNEGEFFIVPKGVEHKPVAPEEVHVVLFEPKSTLNTGNVRNEITRDQLQWV
jgi:mannose-6-phosphate isomerase-like protein (cupin superfamily)